MPVNVFESLQPPKYAILIVVPLVGALVNVIVLVTALYVKSLSPWKIDQDSALYNTSIKGKLRKIVKKTFWIEASLGAYDFLHQIAYTNEEAFHRIDTFGDKDEKSLKTKTLNML